MLVFTPPITTERFRTSDVEWDDDGKSALVELEKIQSQILDVDLLNEASFALATRLLIEGDDEPNFADDFKNGLFRRLRQASMSQPEID
jgi:hypothetical protein